MAMNNLKSVVIQLSDFKTLMNLRAQFSKIIPKGVIGIPSMGLKAAKYLTFGYLVGHTFINLVGHPAAVTGRSMQPTFNPTPDLLGMDLVWVNCWRVRMYNLARGDVAVYVSPKDPSDHLIKRIIAVEGDNVKTKRDYKESVVNIPQGHIWVEGDNKKNTVDSNEYGPVSKGLVYGVATRVIWPLSRRKVLQQHTLKL